MKISHWLIVAAIAALALGIAGVLTLGKPDQAQERRATQPAQKQQQSSAPTRSGREACKQQCSAIRKGYVYRAERRLDSSSSQIIEPEACRCV
jgi:hypothetical protein